MEFSFINFPKIALKIGEKEENFVLFTLYVDNNLKIKGLWFETILFEGTLSKIFEVPDKIYDVLFLPEELTYDSVSRKLHYPVKKPMEGPASKEFAELLNTLGLEKYIYVDVIDLLDKKYYFESKEGKRKKLKDLIIDVEKWKITKCVVKKFLGSETFTIRTVFKEGETIVFKE